MSAYPTFTTLDPKASSAAAAASGLLPKSSSYAHAFDDFLIPEEALAPVSQPTPTLDPKYAPANTNPPSQQNPPKTVQSPKPQPSGSRTSVQSLHSTASASTPQTPHKPVTVDRNSMNASSSMPNPITPGNGPRPGPQYRRPVNPQLTSPSSQPQPFAPPKPASSAMQGLGPAFSSAAIGHSVMGVGTGTDPFLLNLMNDTDATFYSPPPAPANNNARPYPSQQGPGTGRVQQQQQQQRPQNPHQVIAAATANAYNFDDIVDDDDDFAPGPKRISKSSFNRSTPSFSLRGRSASQSQNNGNNGSRTMSMSSKKGGSLFSGFRRKKEAQVHDDFNGDDEDFDDFSMVNGPALSSAASIRSGYSQSSNAPFMNDPNIPMDDGLDAILAENNRYPTGSGVASRAGLANIPETKTPSSSRMTKGTGNSPGFASAKSNKGYSDSIEGAIDIGMSQLASLRDRDRYGGVNAVPADNSRMENGRTMSLSSLSMTNTSFDTAPIIPFLSTSTKTGVSGQSSKYRRNVANNQLKMLHNRVEEEGYIPGANGRQYGMPMSSAMAGMGAEPFPAFQSRPNGPMNPQSPQHQAMMRRASAKAFGNFPPEPGYRGPNGPGPNAPNSGRSMTMSGYPPRGPPMSPPQFRPGPGPNGHNGPNGPNGPNRLGPMAPRGVRANSFNGVNAGPPPPPNGFHRGPNGPNSSESDLPHRPPGRLSLPRDGIPRGYGAGAIPGANGSFIGPIMNDNSTFTTPSINGMMKNSSNNSSMISVSQSSLNGIGGTSGSEETNATSLSSRVNSIDGKGVVNKTEVDEDETETNKKNVRGSADFSGTTTHFKKDDYNGDGPAGSLGQNLDSTHEHHEGNNSNSYNSNNTSSGTNSQSNQASDNNNYQHHNSHQDEANGVKQPETTETGVEKDINQAAEDATDSMKTELQHTDSNESVHAPLELSTPGLELLSEITEIMSLDQSAGLESTPEPVVVPLKPTSTSTTIVLPEKADGEETSRGPDETKSTQQEQDESSNIKSNDIQLQNSDISSVSPSSSSSSASSSSPSSTGSPSTAAMFSINPFGPIVASRGLSPSSSRSRSGSLANGTASIIGIQGKPGVLQSLHGFPSTKNTPLTSGSNRPSVDVIDTTTPSSPQPSSLLPSITIPSTSSITPPSPVSATAPPVLAESVPTLPTSTAYRFPAADPLSTLDSSSTASLANNSSSTIPDVRPLSVSTSDYATPLSSALLANSKNTSPISSPRMTSSPITSRAASPSLSPRSPRRTRTGTVSAASGPPPAVAALVSSLTNNAPPPLPADVNLQDPPSIAKPLAMKDSAFVLGATSNSNPSTNSNASAFTMPEIPGKSRSPVLLTASTPSTKAPLSLPVSNGFHAHLPTSARVLTPPPSSGSNVTVKPSTETHSVSSSVSSFSAASFFSTRNPTDSTFLHDSQIMDLSLQNAALLDEVRLVTMELAESVQRELGIDSTDLAFGKDADSMAKTLSESSAVSSSSSVSSVSSLSSSSSNESVSQSISTSATTPVKLSEQDPEVEKLAMDHRTRAKLVIQFESLLDNERRKRKAIEERLIKLEENAPIDTIYNVVDLEAQIAKQQHELLDTQLSYQTLEEKHVSLNESFQSQHQIIQDLQNQLNDCELQLSASQQKLKAQIEQHQTELNEARERELHLHDQLQQRDIAHKELLDSRTQEKLDFTNQLKKIKEQKDREKVGLINQLSLIEQEKEDEKLELVNQLRQIQEQLGEMEQSRGVEQGKMMDMEVSVKNIQEAAAEKEQEIQNLKQLLETREEASNNKEALEQLQNENKMLKDEIMAFRSLPPGVGLGGLSVPKAPPLSGTFPRSPTTPINQSFGANSSPFSSEDSKGSSSLSTPLSNASSAATSSASLGPNGQPLTAADEKILAIEGQRDALREALRSQRERKDHEIKTLGERVRQLEHRLEKERTTNNNMQQKLLHNPSSVMSGSSFKGESSFANADGSLSSPTADSQIGLPPRRRILKNSTSFYGLGGLSLPSLPSSNSHNANLSVSSHLGNFGSFSGSRPISQASSNDHYDGHHGIPNSSSNHSIHSLGSSTPSSMSGLVIPTGPHPSANIPFSGLPSTPRSRSASPIPFSTLSTIGLPTATKSDLTESLPGFMKLPTRNSGIGSSD